jgi:hypothetical protein
VANRGGQNEQSPRKVAKALFVSLKESLLNGFFEFHTGAEFRHAVGRDLEFGASLGVAAFASFALRFVKAAETNERYYIALFNRLLDDLEGAVQHSFRLGFGNAVGARELVYDLGFVHYLISSKEFLFRETSLAAIFCGEFVSKKANRKSKAVKIFPK